MPDALRYLTTHERVRMVIETMYHIGDKICTSAYKLFERADI